MSLANPLEKAVHDSDEAAFILPQQPSPTKTQLHGKPRLR